MAVTVRTCEIRSRVSFSSMENGECKQECLGVGSVCLAVAFLVPWRMFENHGARRSEMGK